MDCNLNMAGEEGNQKRGKGRESTCPASASRAATGALLLNDRDSFVYTCYRLLIHTPTPQDTIMTGSYQHLVALCVEIHPNNNHVLLIPLVGAWSTTWYEAQVTPSFSPRPGRPR